MNTAHPARVETERITRPPRSRARISAVIPTLNEAANLPHVFARLPVEELFEIILVDGHSTDDTIEIARELCPSVRVLLQNGKGKGNALACGFAAAQGDIIVMLDADGSTDPQEIPSYVGALFDGADFAKGSRFMEGGGSVDITPLRRQGNRFLNGTVNALFGTRYSDLCYGYNAFWADLLPTINVDCDGFEVETLINVRAAKAGLIVAEVPSMERERIHGVSKLHPIRDGLRVLRTILTERFTGPDLAQPSSAPPFRELEGNESVSGSAVEVTMQVVNVPAAA
jgi:glycosyltransferase involved in cell wall biosynthesis